MASEAFHCSKNSLEEGEGEVGMFAEFSADAVRMSVWKMALILVSNFFLDAGAEAALFIRPFWAICWREELIAPSVVTVEGGMEGVAGGGGDE